MSNDLHLMICNSTRLISETTSSPQHVRKTFVSKMKHDIDFLMEKLKKTVSNEKVNSYFFT